MVRRSIQINQCTLGVNKWLYPISITSHAVGDEPSSLNGRPEPLIDKMSPAIGRFAMESALAVRSTASESRRVH